MKSSAVNCIMYSIFTLWTCSSFCLTKLCRKTIHNKPKKAIFKIWFIVFPILPILN